MMHRQELIKKTLLKNNFIYLRFRTIQLEKFIKRAQSSKYQTTKQALERNDFGSLKFYYDKFIYRALYKIIVTAFFLGYFLYFRDNYFVIRKQKKIWIEGQIKKIDNKIRQFVKYLTIKYVFQDKELTSYIAPQLYRLVQQERIKKMFTDLFIMLLNNKALEQDAFKLLSNITHDYLNGSQCLNQFSSLIINQVLRNQYIQENIYRLLRSYVLYDNRENLTKMGEEILISVLSIPGVRNAVAEQITNETNKSFDSIPLYNVAVNAAVNTMNPPKK